MIKKNIRVRYSKSKEKNKNSINEKNNLKFVYSKKKPINIHIKHFKKNLGKYTLSFNHDQYKLRYDNLICRKFFYLIIENNTSIELKKNYKNYEKKINKLNKVVLNIIKKHFFQKIKNYKENKEIRISIKRKVIIRNKSCGSFERVRTFQLKQD